jgi:uncharacterized membrane protein HdeD (DUF308 family)
MNNSNGNQQTEKLKKEQKSIRKVGIVLLILSVVLMLVVSQGSYELVAIPGICAVIGGFLVARSYAHIKYRNGDDQQ